MDDLGRYLRPTRFLDFDHPAIRAYVDEIVGDAEEPVERAVHLYYRVRDDIRYDPYRISLAPDDMTASSCLARGVGFCVPKATLLAACGRAAGIPSRLGFADVRNHLATTRLLEALGTDVFLWHGYTEFLLDGVWRKATPAFNIALCEKFGVLPLEFDGSADSVFHPHDAAGRRHMEYVRDHGTFDDLPLEAIVRAYREGYPNWTANLEGDFGTEGLQERTG